jgi:predicted CopG family antitoxin
MSTSTHAKVIEIREDTYACLRRLREDNSFPTFDMLIREALKAKYGPGLDL